MKCEIKGIKSKKDIQTGATMYVFSTSEGDLSYFANTDEEKTAIDDVHAGTVIEAEVVHKGQYASFKKYAVVSQPGVEMPAVGLPFREKSIFFQAVLKSLIEQNKGTKEERWDEAQFYWANVLRV